MKCHVDEMTSRLNDLAAFFRRRQFSSHRFREREADTSLRLFAAVEVGLVLLERVEFWEEEVTLVAEEPLLRDDVSVMLVGVPVEVPRLVEGLLGSML
jgi:hypothetical protein